MPKEDFLKALVHAEPPYQDAPKVLGTCGWHTTALERFIASGSVEGTSSRFLATSPGICTGPA